MRLDARIARAGWTAAVRALEIEICTMRAAHMKETRELIAALQECRTVIAQIRAELDQWRGFEALIERDQGETASSIH
jgi:hypothetical protein